MVHYAGSSQDIARSMPPHLVCVSPAAFLRLTYPTLDGGWYALRHLPCSLQQRTSGTFCSIAYKHTRICIQRGFPALASVRSNQLARLTDGGEVPGVCRHMAESFLGVRTRRAAVRTAGAGTACGLGKRPRCGVGPAGRALSAALWAHFCGSAPGLASSKEPAAYFIREADLPPLCLKLEQGQACLRAHHTHSPTGVTSSQVYRLCVLSDADSSLQPCVCSAHQMLFERRAGCNQV